MRSVSLPSSILATLRCSRGIALLLATTGLIAPRGIAVAQSTATPGPVVEVSETIQDGGAVEQGTRVNYRFTIRNRGQADLEIRKVSPSCGCSVVKWDRWIKPGSEGVIEAEMDTIQFRGPVTKHLTVITNDPHRRQLDLTISTQVIPLIQVTPRSVARLTVEEHPVSHDFLVERTGGHPMKILEVRPTVSYLRALLTPLPGQGRYKVAVTVTPDAPLGHSLSVVVLRTDLVNQPELRLSLMVDRGIVTVPRSVFWSLQTGKVSEPRQSMVTITRNSGRFQVTGVSSDDPMLQAKVETVRDGSEYRVAVRYTGGWEPGMVKRTLTVTTDDPKQPILKIPIQALFQKHGAGGARVITLD